MSEANGEPDNMEHIGEKNNAMPSQGFREQAIGWMQGRLLRTPRPAEDSSSPPNTPFLSHRKAASHIFRPSSDQKGTPPTLDRLHFPVSQ